MKSRKPDWIPFFKKKSCLTCFLNFNWYCWWRQNLWALWPHGSLVIAVDARCMLEKWDLLLTLFGLSCIGCFCKIPTEIQSRLCISLWFNLNYLYNFSILQETSLELKLHASFVFLIWATISSAYGAYFISHISVLPSPFSNVDDGQRTTRKNRWLAVWRQSAEDLGKSRKIGITESASPVGGR